MPSHFIGILYCIIMVYINLQLLLFVLILKSVNKYFAINIVHDKINLLSSS